MLHHMLKVAKPSKKELPAPIRRRRAYINTLLVRIKISFKTLLIRINTLLERLSEMDYMDDMGSMSIYKFAADYHLYPLYIYIWGVNQREKLGGVIFSGMKRTYL